MIFVILNHILNKFPKSRAMEFYFRSIIITHVNIWIFINTINKKT